MRKHQADHTLSKVVGLDGV